MSFGWSAGDVAECVKILVKIGKALKDSDGSAAQYKDAVEFLKGVKTTVKGVGDIFQNHPDLTFRPALEEHAANLITAITHFRNKTEGYDTSLGVNPTTSEARKAWKKIKLALFGHIEELKLDISYPQGIVNDLIGLQALDILVTLSKKPALSPQQFQDSTEEILREFPVLVTRIEELRSDIADDFITIQQTTESNTQRNFDQIQQDLSEGNTLQQSSFAKIQAATETQDLWRAQVQISITEIRAEAEKSFKALQEVKQAQETNHQNSMQTFQVFSWRNAFRPVISRPIISRPVVKVVKKTVIASPKPARSAPAIGDGSSRGGGSRGASSQGNVSRGKKSRGGSSRGGGPRNAPGGENSRGDSLGASPSQGGPPKGGSSPRGSDSHRGSLKGGPSSRGGNSRGGNSSQGGPSNGGGNSRGGNSRGGDSRRGGSKESSSSGGGNSRGGNSSQGGPSNGGGNSRGGNSRGGDSRGGGSKRGSRGGNSGVNNSPEGLSRGNNVRGGSTRGGSTRGGSTRGGSARGGSTRGVNVRGKKRND